MKTYLKHHGIEGQKWGIRRYQYEDGSYTEEGKKRYGYTFVGEEDFTKKEKNNSGIKSGDDIIDAKWTAKKSKQAKQSKEKKKDNNDPKPKDDKKDSSNQPKSDSSNQSTSDPFKAAKILAQGKQMTNELQIIARDPKRGSIRINNKDYSNLSDDYMRKVINRKSLELQYGDVVGDNQYIMTGREKTREMLQTVGAIAGLGLTIANIWGILHSNNK